MKIQKIIIAPRGAGKTTELIKESAKTGKYIVCLKREHTHQVFKQAEKLGLDIPIPISLEEIERSKGSSIHRDGVLIDNFDLVVNEIVQNYFQGIPIKSASMTTNRLESIFGIRNIFNFSIALDHLRQRKKVRNQSWNGLDKQEMSIAIQFPDKDSKMTDPYIYMEIIKSNGDTKEIIRRPRTPSTLDILSDTWELVE